MSFCAWAAWLGSWQASCTVIFDIILLLIAARFPAVTSVRFLTVCEGLMTVLALGNETVPHAFFLLIGVMDVLFLCIEARRYMRMIMLASTFNCCVIPWGVYVLGPLKRYFVIVTSACARRTGAAARVERRRRER